MTTSVVNYIIGLSSGWDSIWKQKEIKWSHVIFILSWCRDYIVNV